MSKRANKHTFTCTVCDDGQCSIIVKFYGSSKYKVKKGKMPDCIFNDATVNARWERQLQEDI